MEHGARQIKGYERAEIVGRHFSVFFTDDDIDASKPAMLLAEAATKGRAVDEGWRVRRDRSKFWASVVITALLDHQGTVQGFLKVTRDDTQRREAERQARELELLLDRERLARELNDVVIHRIFVAGLAMERVRNSLHDHELEDRVDTAVAELDHAIRDLRLTLFSIDTAEHNR